MTDISTNMPPQHSTFGMVIGNTSRETPSTLTLASATHGKYRREIKVNFFCKKNSSVTELHITSLTEFRQQLQVQSHLEMPRILVQLGHIQRT